MTQTNSPELSIADYFARLVKTGTAFIHWHDSGAKFEFGITDKDCALSIYLTEERVRQIAEEELRLALFDQKQVNVKLRGGLRDAGEEP